MAPSKCAAQVQLRERLTNLRTRVGEEATGNGKSLIAAHQRLDAGLGQRVQAGTASYRRKRNVLIFLLVVLMSLCYVGYYVLPAYSQTAQSVLVRASGTLSYPMQRFTRYLSLPIMYRLPKLATFLRNEECSLSNPYYIPEEDPQEGGANGQFKDDLKNMINKGKSKGKKGTTGKEKQTVACTCRGIRRAGRAVNRTSLKMKHLLRDPGMPIILKVENKSGAADQLNPRLESLLDVIADNHQDFSQELCSVKPLQKGSGKQTCSRVVESVIDQLMSNGSDQSPMKDYTWTYCRDSKVAAHLHSAIDPERYINTKNLIYSQSPTLIVSAAKNSTSNVVPDSMLVDLDIGVYHQISGRRRFVLSPVDCKKCKDIDFSLAAGEVAFFHSQVWQENPQEAFALETDTDDLSITYGYSIGSKKTQLAPMYHTSEWQDDPSDC